MFEQDYKHDTSYTHLQNCDKTVVFAVTSIHCHIRLKDLLLKVM